MNLFFALRVRLILNDVSSVGFWASFRNPSDYIEDMSGLNWKNSENKYFIIQIAVWVRT